MFTPRHESVILFRTHFWDAHCARHFAALRDALGATHDLIAAGYTRQPVAMPADVPHAFHGEAEVAALAYPALAELDPSHPEVFCFFREFPNYRYYWMVEFDVHYTGDWAALVAELGESSADLLSTVVQRRAENPAWCFWPGLRAPGLPEAAHVKGFTPLMRVSAAAMRAIDAAYQAGWAGHYEALWPTAIAAAGLTIEEIGGEGEFTPPARKGMYYTNSRFDPYLIPGSFVFRPSFREEEIPLDPPLLWHPVKPASMYSPIPPPPPRTWRDHALLRPARLLKRRLTRKAG